MGSVHAVVMLIKKKNCCGIAQVLLLDFLVFNNINDKIMKQVNSN